jgi:biotin carboxyl carrier protein
LAGDPDLPGQRVGERIEALGFDGGKTIVDDLLRDIAAGTLRADLDAGDVILGPGSRPWAASSRRPRSAGRSAASAARRACCGRGKRASRRHAVRRRSSRRPGTILSWLKADGEAVEAGEDLVEIETDKATVTHPAEGSGVLSIVATEGTSLPVGATIAQLGDGNAGAADAAPGVSLDTVSGTGPLGRVTRADVLRSAGLEQTPAPSAPRVVASPAEAPPPAPSEAATSSGPAPPRATSRSSSPRGCRASSRGA